MIAVIDYGIGNLRSAEKALLRVGADARLVEGPDELSDVDGIVLPGVGAYGACASALRNAGFDAPLRALVAAGKPFLGLCVGFQLLYEFSEESPGTPGLGVLKGTVRRLPAGVKLPQMQWNTVQRVTGRSVRMAEGLPEEPWFYFVHTFAPYGAEVEGSDVALWCEYGARFPAAIERGTVWGTQFHPEKSGPIGLSLLRNFVTFCERSSVNAPGNTEATPS